MWDCDGQWREGSSEEPSLRLAHSRFARRPAADRLGKRLPDGILHCDGSGWGTTILVVGTAGDPDLTQVKPGDRLSISATSFDHLLRADGPIVSSMVEDSLGGRVAREYGMQSWIAIPIRDANGVIVGMLALLSKQPDTFPQDGLDTFVELTADLCRQIHDIVTAAGIDPST